MNTNLNNTDQVHQASPVQPVALIDITPKALEHLQSTLEKEKQQKPDQAHQLAVRFSVVGGGCSGLSYKVDFSLPKERDHQLTYGTVAVLVDPKSAIYLKGMTVDYQDGLNGKGITFTNPNAKNTCGCGESFTV